MMKREQVTATYLGNGIAIPHGLPQDRELIQYTGLSVLQLPEGVEWNSGEIVYLVVGIAARSDEHIDVLAKLTDVLEDEATVMRLARTRYGRDHRGARSVAAGGNRSGAAPAPAAMMGSGLRADVEVTGGTGLHAVRLRSSCRWPSSSVRMSGYITTARPPTARAWCRCFARRRARRHHHHHRRRPDAAKAIETLRTPLPKDWERRRKHPDSAIRR